MPTKVKAVYEGGVFRPLEPLDLTEKTPVELTIEPLTIALLQQAAHLSVTHELLTNDAALLAHMQALGITHLATNDDDFDKVTGITVWKPR